MDLYRFVQLLRQAINNEEFTQIAESLLEMLRHLIYSENTLTWFGCDEHLQFETHGINIYFPLTTTKLNEYTDAHLDFLTNTNWEELILWVLSS
ncbi:MAG: hypothetical protein QXD64_08725 [Thermoplasmata archaeon]